MVLDTNSSSLIKKQKISWCKIFSSLQRVLGQIDLGCPTLYHSSTLQLPCLRLVNRSKWALTSLDWGLQNSSELFLIVSKLNSSLGRFYDTYWSIPKSLLHAITFLHSCFSGRVASSHSSMFMHFFNLHLRNLW